MFDAAIFAETEELKRLTKEAERMHSEGDIAGLEEIRNACEKFFIGMFPLLAQSFFESTKLLCEMMDALALAVETEEFKCFS